MIDIELDDRIVQQMDRIEQDRLWIADRFDRIRLLPDLLFFLLSFLRVVSFLAKSSSSQSIDLLLVFSRSQVLSFPALRKNRPGFAIVSSAFPKLPARLLASDLFTFHVS